MTGARPVRIVPGGIVVLLGAALALQVLWGASAGGDAAGNANLPPPPSAQLLRAASLDEPQLAARAAMIYLQTFDLRGDNPLPYAELDYRRLTEWLQAILATDPRSSYALFTASRIYAEVADPEKCRAMLEFLYASFQDDPGRRWPWLAHAALIAKHRLKDLPRALEYARAIEQHAQDAKAPLWAKQMQAFLLEEMNELEAARILLGGLVASGYAQDSNERRFLQARLQALELRLAAR